MITQLGHPLNQPLSCDALDGLLACRINVQNINVIRSLKALRKIIHQELGARIAVGLENSNDPFGAPKTGRLQRGANLRRMMPVIIDDRYAFEFHLDLKPAVGATEVRQPLTNQFGTQSQL